ncbi:MAG: four helix bundle protein [Ignavibacteria bacterium]|nr:four helix bundle protein [Ignavibacteria bacterium]
MMEYTKRRNLNRGYMKLEVWNDAIELFVLVDKILGEAGNIDLKLRGQILASVQSVSANLAEGYCRKSINEYLYFLNVSLGSMGELMTRMIGLKVTRRLTDADFESFDQFHYRVENKLLSLKKSLQAKRRGGSWEEEIREQRAPYAA